MLLLVRPEWQIVCEVSDGSEAVQRAEELRPDLIVLDISLPKLDGIEAARRIRQVSPNSKIVFLTMDNSPDVAQVALSIGAQGYVHKVQAQSDLLPAIDTVLRGEQFVSNKLGGTKVSDDAQESKAPRFHEVLFYSDDEVFLDSFTRFIAAALKNGNTAIAIATKSHQDGLLQRLKVERVDVDGTIQQGKYVSLDADESLSAIMVNGLPDPVRFFEGLNGLIEAAFHAATAEHPRVAFCGERVGLLWAEGKTDAAIRLEQLCNDLAKTHEVDILCAYALSCFQGDEDEHVFRSICAEHSAVHSQ